MQESTLSADPGSRLRRVYPRLAAATVALLLNQAGGAQTLQNTLGSEKPAKSISSSGPSTSKIAFNIKAQPLEDALNEFARQTGYQVLFQSGMADKQTAPLVDGTLTPDAALQTLLSNSTLRYKFVNARTVTISAPDNASPTKLSSSSDNSLRISQQPSVEGATSAASEGPKSPSDAPASTKDSLQEILVTGSHIRGIDNKTTQLIVIDRQAIDQSGYSTAQELFQTLPQNFNGGGVGNNDGGQFSAVSANQNFTNSNAVNLRGLGENSTLVLINGHRVAPAVYGIAVDLSTIPLAAIERVEILPEGASALYGSDAVGGVVNIILRNDFQGAETSVRYGTATSGGRSERSAAQLFGDKWDSGNVVATLQVQNQNRLTGDDRPSARGLTEPNDLLPDTESYGLSLDGRQSVTESLELHGDVLLSRRNIRSDNSQLEPDLVVAHPHAKSQLINITPGATLKLGEDWSIDLTPSYSKQDSSQFSQSIPIPFGTGYSSTTTTFTEVSAELILSGKLLELPGGALSTALGGSYRHEKFSQNQLLFGSPIPAPGVKRHVSAEFAELYVPIVGAGNSLAAVRALDLSLAVRHDRYSDFGSVSTPHYGLRWAPVEDLNVRASYGKSFRAPNASELSGAANSYLSVLPFSDPNGGSGTVPGLLYAGSVRTLQPERAKVFDIGVEFKPHWLTGLTLTYDWYDVRYSNRIVIPPYAFNAFANPGFYGALVTPLANDAAAQAYVNSAVASGAQYNDYVGSGIVGVRDVLDIRQQNATSVHQSGADVSAVYSKQLTPGTLTGRVNATYIREIDTKLFVKSATQNLVNTVGNPVHWRLRADAAWSTRAALLSVAANYTNRYVNSADIGNPPIASWVTFDLLARLNLDGFLDPKLWRGSTITLSVQNAFNRAPPHVDAPAFLQVSYDPANANPLGRSVAVEFRKQW